jgi:radical SAM protein with 4Fe4S-binding SPASM domain
MRNCIRLGLPVILQTTVTEWNLEEIPDLIRFASRESAQAFNLYYLVCTGRGERLTDITPQQYEDSFTCLIEAQANYSNMMVRAKCAPHVNRIAHQRGLPFLSSAGCPAGTSYLRISPEGDVTPCPYLPLVTGNLRKESLQLIWEESVLFNELRELQLKGRCGACEFSEVCIGCRARALAINGDYLAEDPWCNYQPGGGSPLPANEVAWSTEAEERLQRVPSFIRSRVKLSVERYAGVKGFDTVTVGLMDEVRRAMGSHTVRK